MWQAMAQYANRPRPRLTFDEAAKRGLLDA